MRYKLKLSRSNEIMNVVDIPADIFMETGNILLVDGKYHEIKNIIRPAFTVVDFKKGITQEQHEEGLAILIIGDSFPLI